MEGGGLRLALSPSQLKRNTHANKMFGGAMSLLGFSQPTESQDQEQPVPSQEHISKFRAEIQRLLPSPAIATRPLLCLPRAYGPSCRPALEINVAPSSIALRAPACCGELRATPAVSIESFSRAPLRLRGRTRWRRKTRRLAA